MIMLVVGGWQEHMDSMIMLGRNSIPVLVLVPRVSVEFLRHVCRDSHYTPRGFSLEIHGHSSSTDILRIFLPQLLRPHGLQLERGRRAYHHLQRLVGQRLPIASLCR